MIDLTEQLAKNGVSFQSLGKVLCHQDSTVTIGAGSVIKTPITVLGGGNHVTIGDRCSLQGGITLKCRDSSLSIGAGTTWGAVNLMMHESNLISIGTDCMFSVNILLDVSDMHPIYCATSGDRINFSEKIIIGDHVWIGYGATILRGTLIQDGCIVGAGSVVRGEFQDRGCIIAGNPRRVIKNGIRWERNLPLESGNISI